MRFIDLQESFERELNQFYDGLNKPKSADTEWWLNRGLEKFYKTRYSGINFKQKGFEQDQKRIDDLRTLVKYVELNTNKISDSEFSVGIPDDYIMLLGDTAVLLPTEGIDIPCWQKDENGSYIKKFTDTLEVTIETIDREKSNSLSEYRLHYCLARPLKIIRNEYIYLFTDGNYQVCSYQLTYLRKPEYINIHKSPYSEYTDMPKHTHSEIVKIAAQMYIENQGNQRLNSHNDEVNTME